jgi:hypothetical protein
MWIALWPELQPGGWLPGKHLAGYVPQPGSGSACNVTPPLINRRHGLAFGSKHLSSVSLHLQGDLLFIVTTSMNLSFPHHLRVDR